MFLQIQAIAIANHKCEIVKDERVWILTIEIIISYLISSSYILNSYCDTVSLHFFAAKINENVPENGKERNKFYNPG